jgi:hypothetical protein
MRVAMLLADAADVVGGKLYVLGGGWSQLGVPEVPTNMALAIKIDVPWDQTNTKHQVVAKLITADGEEVEVNDEPVRAEVEFEVGRPPGLPPGTAIDAPLALSFSGLMLAAGTYVWELEIDGEPAARAPFRVLQMDSV